VLYLLHRSVRAASKQGVRREIGQVERAAQHLVECASWLPSTNRLGKRPDSICPDWSILTDFSCSEIAMLVGLIRQGWWRLWLKVGMVLGDLSLLCVQYSPRGPSVVTRAVPMMNTLSRGTEIRAHVIE
jgi:hypothetical protein